MKTSVFIDGEAGTTGLQINERLVSRGDISLIHLSEDARKDTSARKAALNEADVAILCLPDDAAREAVSLIDGDTRVIDASTAHRAAHGWVYGFPEYSANHRDVMRASARISNPGCYALTAVAILYPLVAGGLIPANYPLNINAVSGYSGGGKSLIAAFEDPTAEDHTNKTLYAYALGLQHKHIPEITRWGGLVHAPIFVPIVANYYKGMLVQVPLPLWHLPGAPTAKDLHEVLTDHYASERFVTVAPLEDGSTILDPQALNGTNELHLHVLRNDSTGQAVVAGVIDNLGKGASGQAVQTLNLLIGAYEGEGL